MSQKVRCRECRHWAPPSTVSAGFCRLIGVGAVPAQTGAALGGSVVAGDLVLLTGPEFSCGLAEKLYAEPAEGWGGR